jgi:AraC-like DNA-binding protein
VLTRVIKDERIKPLISNAIAEIDSENFQSTELLTALFKQAVIYTVRAFQNLNPQKPYDNATQNEILCYKLMNYIDTHIYSMKNLSDLAKTTDYSYGYLSTIFKKTTKDSLLSYYQRKKLDVARLLILERKLTVTEISEMLNYSSVYALSKAFTKQYGMSPRAYQTSNNTPPPPKIPESVENTATNKIEFWHK